MDRPWQHIIDGCSAVQEAWEKLTAQRDRLLVRLAELEDAHRRAVALHTEEQRLRWEAVTRADAAKARVAELEALLAAERGKREE